MHTVEIGKYSVTLNLVAPKFVAVLFCFIRIAVRALRAPPNLVSRCHSDLLQFASLGWLKSSSWKPSK